jgi:DNA-binding transcriptional regulator YdaS (Cro superfamily)
MKLKDYLYFEEIMVKDFAKSIDYSPIHISGYLNKRHRLSKKAARMIDHATGGKVTAEEIMLGNPPKKNSTGDKNILQNTAQ